MKNKNLRGLEIDTEDKESVSFGMFIVGSLSLILLVFFGIYSYIQSPDNFNFWYHEHIYYILVMLLAIIPFSTSLIISKLERSDIPKKHKLFDKLLKDHVIFSLLNDKELRKEWSVLRKAFLIRIDELVQQGYIDKINYKYNEYDKDVNVNKFIRELMDYKKEKDNDRQAIADQIKTAEINKIKEQADNEKAVDLLNKYKKSKNT